MRPWIKASKNVTRWARIPGHRFWANGVRCFLGTISYNFGDLLRWPVMPLAILSWSLTSLRRWPLKTGGQLIRQARYFILPLAVRHWTRGILGRILGRIEPSARHHS